tara:strand:+ start:402 stop:767 length:366 start_codon:yes stop_codon:yes gene_type:complete
MSKEMSWHNLKQPFLGFVIYMSTTTMEKAIPTYHRARELFLGILFFAASRIGIIKDWPPSNSATTVEEKTRQRKLSKTSLGELAAFTINIAPKDFSLHVQLLRPKRPSKRNNTRKPPNRGG